MRFLSNIILIFFTLSVSYPQEVKQNQYDKKNKKTGSWIGYHNNSNSKRYTGQFLAGIPKGIFHYYAIEGHLSAKVNFINDSISSSEMYYDNGNIMARGKFINKMKQGKWYTYSRFGDLLNVFNFNAGAMQGKQYLYYPANT